MNSDPNDLTMSELWTSRGFRVRGRDDTRNETFSRWVVAKRKDIVGERLASITISPEPPWPAVPPTVDHPSDPRARVRHAVAVGR